MEPVENKTSTEFSSGRVAQHGLDAVTIGNHAKSTSLLTGNSIELNLDEYKLFLQTKYPYGKYAKSQYNYSIMYHEFLSNPSLILTLPKTHKPNALKATVCLSKYLGCYEEYKQQLKSYGIKWATGNTSFSGFLSLVSKKHDTLPEYIREIKPHITASEYVFVKFVAVTGLRVSEAMQSFNMIIDLYAEGKLGEYYDATRNVLEHYKYPKFLRTTKNTFLSFVSQELIDQICFCDKVTYPAIHCRLFRRKVKLRLKELRSYNATVYMRNGLLAEEVDVLQGRVSKSVLVRHYLGIDLGELSSKVFSIQRTLLDRLGFS